MPVVVVEMVTGLHVNSQWTTACLVLELQLSATDDAQFDVIRGTLCVEDYSVLNSGLELQVNVSRVTHVEPGEVDRGISNPEGDDVVEEV